jgi:hypothetical protein
VIEKEKEEEVEAGEVEGREKEETTLLVIVAMVIVVMMGDGRKEMTLMSRRGEGRGQRKTMTPRDLCQISAMRMMRDRKRKTCDLLLFRAKIQNLRKRIFH